MFNISHKMSALAAIALISATVASSPAFAGEQTQTVVANQNGEALPTMTVSYGDLNLTSGSGQRSLTHRVRAAVEFVCPSASGEHDLRTLMENDRCSKAAWTSARPQIEAAVAQAINEAANHSGASLSKVAILIASPSSDR